MSKTNLKLVPKPKPKAAPRVYTSEHGMKRMATLRAALLAAAVQYVREGTDGSRNDRVRTSSEATGISRSLIEIAVEK